MKIIKWNDGHKWNDPNLRWGNPSYLLEPGDPEIRVIRDKELTFLQSSPPNSSAPLRIKPMKEKPEPPGTALENPAYGFSSTSK